MKASDKALKLIEESEGCRLTAYFDSVKVPTIGYGHTSGLKPSDVGTLTITQQQAIEYLKIDISKSESKVNKYDNIYHWTQNEFDALVSFAFNIGSIDQLTANGTRSKDTIANKILEYNKAGGKVLNGLVKRRKKEHDLFVSSSSPVKELKGVMEFHSDTDDNIQITPHFKVKEFKCKDMSNNILIDVDFVKDKLENVRNHFNAPVIINSAYRTESYNKKVGGAKNSYHIKGRAFDIVVKGHTPLEVASYAYKIGVKGIILYNGFVHLDSRDSVYFAMNNNGYVTKVSEF